jgi:hypothetical protein
MNLRTTFRIEPSSNKIDYNTPVMFIGSCFASEIGSRFEEGKMNVLINPAGSVYNPVSVSNTINNIIENKEFKEKDLYIYKGINISFLHYSNFSSEDIKTTLDKINSSSTRANEFLKYARYLFITFGTARVYRFKETNRIVSNCHKLPSSLFSGEILEVEEIVSIYEETIKRLQTFNKDLRIIFTISPVRHLKDGAHGNQISKSILFLAVEKLLKNSMVNGYFPAYELMMDDLRDYRYYSEDMLHPSATGVDYIWKAFSDCYFESHTKSLWKEIRGITNAMNHRFLSDSKSGRREFAEIMLKKISAMQKGNPRINLSEEKSYFTNIKKAL